MYKPDRSFLQKLSNIDPRLSCSFSNKKKRFFIFYKRPVGKTAVLEIGARKPDERDIKMLQDMDTQSDHTNKAFDKLSSQQEKIEKDFYKNGYNDFRDVTKDNKIQIKNALSKYGNTGKGVTGFRQIKR